VCATDLSCTGEADAACPPPDPVDTCAHTQGYWHRQCLGDGLITPGRGGGRGPTHVLEPNWKDILAATDAYLADVLAVNGGACEEGMVADPASDTCERGLKQLTALVFNVNSGRIQLETPIDVSAGGCTATTVGELLDDLSALWTDPQRTENDCKQINDCAVIVNELDDEALAVAGDETTSETPEETLSTPIAGSGTRTVTQPIEQPAETATEADTSAPSTLVGVPTRSDAPAELEVPEAEAQPVDEDPLDAIERHLATVGKTGLSEEDRKASEDALLTALSGGYDPEVRLQIVRGLIGSVDPMLHSLLARHVEDILDEARDFEKTALASEAERLLKSLEPATEE
jgi:hypothetical protein